MRLFIINILSPLNAFLYQLEKHLKLARKKEKKLALKGRFRKPGNFKRFRFGNHSDCLGLFQINTTVIVKLLTEVGYLVDLVEGVDGVLLHVLRVGAPVAQLVVDQLAVDVGGPGPLDLGHQAGLLLDQLGGQLGTGGDCGGKIGQVN